MEATMKFPILLGVVLASVASGADAAKLEHSDSFVVTGKLLLKNGRPAKRVPVQLVAESEDGSQKVKIGAEGVAIWAGEGETSADGGFTIHVRRDYFQGAPVRFSIQCLYEESLRAVVDRKGRRVHITIEEGVTAVNAIKFAGTLVVGPSLMP
jgi:hypothetical protein